MELTKEEIINKTDEDELFCLFGTLIERLKEDKRLLATDNMGDFQNYQEFMVMDIDLIKTIREMKRDYALPEEQTYNKKLKPKPDYSQFANSPL